MKKLLLIILVILNSCSDSDSSSDQGPNNNPPVSQDLIIGKWTTDKTVYLLDDQIVEVVAPNLCDLLTSYEFFEDNTIILISYIGGNNCELETNEFEYFNWTKLSEDEYNFISKHPGEAEQSTIYIVKFESNSIMYWVDYFGEGFTTENGNEFDERRSYLLKD